jgi:hypothetical protein
MTHSCSNRPSSFDRYCQVQRSHRPCRRSFALDARIDTPPDHSSIMSNTLVDLLGEQLIEHKASADGVSRVSTDVLKDKAVGVYFSSVDSHDDA